MKRTRVIAFTGTREGMTAVQKSVVRTILLKWMGKYDLSVLHGGCHGADTDFDAIANDLGVYIIVHPGDYKQKHNFQHRTCAPVRPYLQRNADMVLESNVLMVCPSGMMEVVRSGTWATVRRARANARKTIIVYPNGDVEREVPK